MELIKGVLSVVALPKTLMNHRSPLPSIETNEAQAVHVLADEDEVCTVNEPGPLNFHLKLMLMHLASP